MYPKSYETIGCNGDQDYLIPRPKEFKIAFKQLHGFSDASEKAYAGVVYLRLVDTNGHIHTSFVIAKTKVAPIKRLTIPRLELCGARLLAQLLHHCLSRGHFCLETDSTIVLNWMSGNPRWFKTYVALSIVELIPSNRWNHVEGIENPASRGILPLELLSHKLWWEDGIQQWPLNYMLPGNQPSEEVEEICSHISDPIIPRDQFSSFTRLTRVTAWVKRFVNTISKPKWKNWHQELVPSAWLNWNNWFIQLGDWRKLIF